MKYAILIFITLLLESISAQTVDSIALQQIDSLIQDSRSLAQQQEFDLAWQLIDSAEIITLEKFGNMSEQYGNICNNRGSIKLYTGDYPGAEGFFMNAKAIWEKVFGKEHTNYTGSLINLAYLQGLMGNFERAELLYLEAKEIFEVQLKDLNHPFYANLLNNLSILYLFMGNYEKAEPLCLQVLDLRKKEFGTEHPQYAKSLNSLAALYTKMGNYEKAEPLHFEVKEIREKVLGKENIAYAESIYNLAALYRVMGNYEKAEPFLLDAKVIREKILGREHPTYAETLHELATLCHRMGNLEKAETLYLEAMDIREKALGKDHPDYAASMDDLAGLYVYMGKYEVADSLYLEANSTRERALGKEHPDYAEGLLNQAGFYITIKNYERAEVICLESKSILEKALGVEHPSYGAILHNLASLYLNAKNYENAEQYFLELSALNQTLLLKGLHHLSEHELNQYLLQFEASQNLLLTITQQYGSENLIAACLNNNLFYKGFLLNAANQLKRLALSDSATSEQFNMLRSSQRRLTDLYTVPITERDSAKIAEIESNVNNLEKDLTRSVSGYGDATRQIKWQEVQKILKQDEAVIEFVSYKCNNSLQTDSVMYAAIIIKAGESAPHFTTLFKQKSLNALFEHKEKEADITNINESELASRGIISTSTMDKFLYSESLYEILWKPLESDLNGIHTIHFSPSGMLHRINMNAIPISKSELLSDRFRLLEVSSARQLVIPSMVKNVSNEALLFGGIFFDRDTTTQYSEQLAAYSSTGANVFQSTDITLRGGEWNYLPGTESEVNSIEAIMISAGMNATLKKGKEATEESVKSVGMNNSISPRILHLATHGYFFPDVDAKTSDSMIGIKNEPVFKSSDQPMLRSGLIMAGGNATWKGEKTQEGAEDGILTAYEISQMNLSNTELVVLSACETGLGDIQGNEGVYGLQRAFKIAGAKYIIMSLWQVPDKQTSLLMTTFYKKWMEEKMTIPDAFHASQKQLRDAGLDAYQWAGFVLVE